MEHERPDTEAAADAPRARRRGRTTLLIATALVLGALAGTVTGYAVQYHRAPTPLPPLAQQSIDTPEPVAANADTSLRSINANRWGKAEDDLTRLLVETPAGVDVQYSGPESPDAYAADYYKDPNVGIDNLLREGVRRIATLRWREHGRTSVTIRLMQYRQRTGAAGFQHGHGYMADPDHAGNAGKDLPGVPADFGHLWVDSKAHQGSGSVPTRGARVIARRGDVVMDVKYWSDGTDVDEGAVVELAKRQWERL